MRLTIVFVCLVLFCNAFKTTANTPKSIHVFVALCDNANQGIVPVPATLGNGQDPANNLYWGAMYGVKTWFKKHSNGWKLVKKVESSNPYILERLLFKHTTENTFLLADAWDGKYIKDCTVSFLQAANAQHSESITIEGKSVPFGGQSDLISYVGHDGLMDFDVQVNYHSTSKAKPKVIILACFSKSYFSSEIKKAGATPILWTTHLMAPEAYSLKAAFDGWMKNESAPEIEARAEVAYNQYQKCGMKGAKALFTSGF